MFFASDLFFCFYNSQTFVACLFVCLFCLLCLCLCIDYLLSVCAFHFNQFTYIFISLPVTARHKQGKSFGSACKKWKKWLGAAVLARENVRDDADKNKDGNVCV